MNALGLIGLLLAIAVLIVLCYRGLPALPASLVAALVAIVFNAMPIWESYSGAYIKGYASGLSFLFMLASGALFAKFMEVTGSAQAIAYKLLDWFGEKRTILVSILIIAILTYGGVSVMVVILIAAPIMFTLFERANLPRHLTMLAFSAGACTFTLTALPGVPTSLNAVPTVYLGTTMTAAPILGIICGIAMFVLCMVYAKYAEKKARLSGEGFTYPEGTDLSLYQNVDRSSLPSAGKAFAPALVVSLGIIIGSQFIKDAFMLTVAAMLAGTLVAFLLNRSSFKGKDMKQIVSTGLGGGVNAVNSLCAILAFGSVIQSTPAFQMLIAWVTGQSMNPYVLGVFTTCVFCGVTGSSGGGVALAYQAIGPILAESGCNMEIMHRLTAMASGILDSVPHSVGVFLPLSVLGLTHKNSYKHMFVTSIIVPAIVVISATAICIMLGF